MKDEQVLHLLRILQMPSCNIWCLNIGETYNVKSKTWAAFTNGLKKTKITHMYASEHTISGPMKEKIRKSIRKNRKKHNMHIDPENLDVIIKCTHCWWNPMNAKVLQPYIRQRGYEDLLLDKIAQVRFMFTLYIQRSYEFVYSFHSCAQLLLYKGLKRCSD